MLLANGRKGTWKIYSKDMEHYVVNIIKQASTSTVESEKTMERYY